MSNTGQQPSFNAYTGTGESLQRPRRAGAVPLQAPSALRPRRGRWWVLVIVLCAGSGAAVHHYAAPLQERLGLNDGLQGLSWGEMAWPELSLSQWQTLRLDEEWLNRPIRSVRFDSPLQRITDADIRQVLAGHLDQGFFSIDVRQVKAELEENPWVDHASVRRVWPDALTVTVTEQRPIAQWGDRELLNQRAERFAPPRVELISGLPRLDGPPGSEEQVMRQYQQFSQLLQAPGLRISTLVVSELGSWRMVINDRVVINVGREQVLERLQRFIVLYEGALHQQMEEISVIDLRYRNGIAVRTREPESDEVAAL